MADVESYEVVRLSYSDVFGKPGTHQRLIAILGSLRLAEVVDYLGRASAVLFNASVQDESVQRQLSEVFFASESASVWSAVERWKQQQRKQDRPTAFVLFDEASIALTVKVALFASSPSAATLELDLPLLGEAVLIANGLVDANAPLGVQPNTQRGLDAWVYYMYTVSTFQANDQTLHRLARTYDLFLSDKPHLSASGSYMNLPERVLQATGLDPQTLWSILFAYLAHFYSIDASSAHRSPAWIHRTKFFEEFTFSDAQVANFLRLLARPLNDIASEVRVSTSVNALRPYDHSALAKSPLIEIEDRAYCPVLRLLLERVTTGLYHTLLNATPGSDGASNGSRAQFMTYVGDVFEDYVDRLIKRVLDQRLAKNLNGFVYLDPQTLRALAPPIKKGEESPICDHLIWDGDSLVLWDSKAKSFPANVRAGEDQQTFLDRFGSLIDGAAKQLDSTANLARAGAFAAHGVDPTMIRHVFPAIVSLPDHTLQPYMHGWIQKRVRDQGLLPSSASHSLELVMVGDLEQLEGAWATGKSLSEFFRVKNESGRWRDQSIHNYIALGGDPDLQKARSPYLDSLYLRLTSMTEQFLAQNAKNGVALFNDTPT